MMKAKEKTVITPLSRLNIMLSERVPVYGRANRRRNLMKSFIISYGEVKAYLLAGILMSAPARIASLFIPFAFLIASTVTPYFLAMCPRVSPRLMVWVVCLCLLVPELWLLFWAVVVFLLLVWEEAVSFFVCC